MLKYEDAVAVARISMKQSTRTDNPVVAEELRLIAKGYQMRAAAMNGGLVPYIGEGVADPESEPGTVSYDQQFRCKDASRGPDSAE
jgi:hypothetical protein